MGARESGEVEVLALAEALEQARAGEPAAGDPDKPKVAYSRNSRGWVSQESVRVYWGRDAARADKGLELHRDEDGGAEGTNLWSRREDHISSRREKWQRWCAGCQIGRRPHLPRSDESEFTGMKKTFTYMLNHICRDLLVAQTVSESTSLDLAIVHGWFAYRVWIR